MVSPMRSQLTFTELLGRDIQFLVIRLPFRNCGPTGRTAACPLFLVFGPVFRSHTYLDSSVSREYFLSARDLVWFLYRSLKLFAIISM